MKITGYGKGWQEEKATGWRRLLQIGREPATTSTYIWGIAVSICIILLSLLISGCQSSREWTDKDLYEAICVREGAC